MKKTLYLLLIVTLLSISMVYAQDISPRRGEPCPTPGCLGSIFQTIVWKPNSEYREGPHGNCHIVVPHIYKWEEKWILYKCNSCGFSSGYNTFEGRNYRCVIN